MNHMMKVIPEGKDYVCEYSKKDLEKIVDKLYNLACSKQDELTKEE